MALNNRSRQSFALIAPALALALCVGLGASTVQAKEAKTEAQSAQETKKFGMGRIVAEKLLEAYDLLENERYDEALAIVDGLAKRRKLQPPEIAQIHRFRAYIFVNKDQNERATVEFEKSLAIGAMEPAAEQVMIYSLAQIYTELGKYDQALALMNRWFESAESPKADAFFLKAMILVQQGNFRDAAEPAEKALELADKPKESWLTLHGVINSELKDLPKVERTLEQLVELAPTKPQYWMQLAAVQHHLGHEEKALATMQLAYQAGLLKGDKEVRQLASLLFLGQQPFECAQLIENALASGVVAADVDSYRLMANCLIAARESEKALEPLAKAGELAPDGDLYLLLGQLYLQRERFELAIDALEKGLQKVKPEQRGSAHLLLGIAQLGDEQFAEAERSFKLAVGDAKVHRAAESYLKFLEERRVTQAQQHASNPSTGG
jgi:tetratricopeptide (TPR) repeat protein